MTKQEKKSPSVFGRRLREARLRVGISQDKLGVQIGLDEATSSARISRYETGEHEAPYITSQKLATALGVPVAFLYCDNDGLAEIILRLGKADASSLENIKALLAKNSS